MQISSNSFYDLTSKRMSTLSSRMTELQTEIATGKKTVSASANPGLTQQLAQLTRLATDDVTYAGNMTAAASSLQQSDSTLNAVATQLQGALELAVQAGNGTLNDANRTTIADQLSAASSALFGLANTKDINGQPLFGGSNGGSSVTKNADGSYTLADTPPTDIPISDSQSVQSSETASRIFAFGDTNTFAVLDGLAAALRSGATSSSTATTTAAITKLTDANNQVSVARASVGARAARVELQQGLLTSAKTDRAELRSSLEDTDVTSAIVELQKMMTQLSATQSSFSKLSSLSLFDYLR